MTDKPVEEEQRVDVEESLAARTISMLRQRKPNFVSGVPKELHQLGPHIPKKQWTELGDKIKVAEKPLCDSIPGEYWISLRCDGTGFSKLTRQLRRAGVFQKGWSQDFADAMIHSCHELMSKFNGRCGYTQSDEMTVLIAPTNVIRGERQCHQYNGRVQKLASLAASTVTANFNYQILLLCQKFGINYPGNLLATFDCRVGMYKTKEEAVSLLLWRAYDCGVNGVSDAVFHQKGNPNINGAGSMMKKATHEKLQWLQENSLLPLGKHQREGTYFVKRKHKLEATNKKTGEPVVCLRSRIDVVDGNLLLLCKEGKMFPADDEL